MLLGAQRVARAIVRQVGHRAVHAVRPDSHSAGHRDGETEAVGGPLPAALRPERDYARLTPPEVQAEALETVRPRLFQGVQELDVRRLWRRNAPADRRQVEKPQILRLLG